MILSKDVTYTNEIRRLSEEQWLKMCKFVNAHRINSSSPGYDVQNIYTAVNIKLAKIKND